jgi:hypothetical protein
MQVVKCSLLNNSVDETVRKLYETKEHREAQLTRVWRGSQLHKTALAEVRLNQQFPRSQNRQGLGSGIFKNHLTVAETRTLVNSAAKKFKKEERIQHSHSLSRQSVWLQWAEKAHPFDFSWKNLIWGSLGPHVLKFVLNSSINWIKTPDLLAIWTNNRVKDICPICPKSPCTLHHIISNCGKALADKRYTWRHDSVLLHIETVLRTHIHEFNSRGNSILPIPPISKSFVKAGENSTSKGTKFRRSLLQGASDWEILVDFEQSRIVFPPEIYSTPERPDIIIWSRTAKRVILIELTCPAEEGIGAAKSRKEARYYDLQRAVNDDENNPYSCSLWTIEVGARGFVGNSVFHCLSRLGVPPKIKRKLGKTLSLVAAKCSYAIYLSSSNRKWARHRPLLRLESVFPSEKPEVEKH